MAQAIHYHERVTSDGGTTSTTLGTVLTVSAADLTGAGFQNNDEVIVLLMVMIGQAGTGECIWRVQYNAATITNSVANPRMNGGANEKTAGFMWRGNLATVNDFIVQRATGTSGQSVNLHKVEFWIIRATDFGIEGTDWVWNKSTTDVANTTTYSSTSRAAVTIPASTGTQDWVVFWYVHIAMDSTSVRSEAQGRIDAAVNAGDWSEEGNSTTEENARIMFHYATLTSTTHSVDTQTRDDVATAANNHRESAILAFRKNVWTDIFFHDAGTQLITTATDTQVATITNSVSVNQDALIYGEGKMDIDVVSVPAYLWIRQGGATIIDPVIDDSTGLSNGYAKDVVDELPLIVLAKIAATSGAQDLDLFNHHTAGSSKNILFPKLLFWGMNLASRPSVLVGHYPMKHMLIR